MKVVTKNDIFLLEEIVKKNFSSKYKDSVLGILWTILNPLLMMSLFTICFSTIFARNTGNYPVYFLCGWCTFSFFTTAISASMNALKGNKNILQKTPAPKYIFILGAVISELLNYMIMLVLLVIVMILTQAPFYFPTIIFSFIPILSLLVMITGLGLMLSVVCVYYTDVIHLWNVVSMMIMYASAIFYPMTIIPEPYRHYLMLNPLYWIIDLLRCFVYLGIFPQLHQVLNSLLISAIILVFGIIVFKKYESSISMKF